MDRLERQIGHELDRLAPAGAPDMAAIVRVWTAAVGGENARRAWPARIARDGTLHVHAVDSIWAFQLGMLADTILERLREHLAEAAPQSLRFVAGPVPEPAAETVPSAPSAALEPAPEDVAAAASLASSIEDAELRETVARAAAASLARTRFGTPSEARSDRGF